MKIITIWERLNDDEWEHNHTEEGYDVNKTAPTPKFDSQKKSWANGTWRAFRGYKSSTNDIYVADKYDAERDHARADNEGMVNHE